MLQYDRLYARHIDIDSSLFRVEEHATNKTVVRADLKREACSICGKFDEMEALRSGAYNTFRVTLNEDFLGSWEHFPIVSARFRKFLDSTVGNIIRYFDTASMECFIALPVNVILPDARDKSFRALNKCPRCGRYSELLWGTIPFNMTSEISIGVIHMENRMGLMPLWVISKDVSIALKKVVPKFKGLLLDPLKNVANPNPNG